MGHSTSADNKQPTQHQSRTSWPGSLTPSRRLAPSRVSRHHQPPTGSMSHHWPMGWCDALTSLRTRSIVERREEDNEAAASKLRERLHSSVRRVNYRSVRGSGWIYAVVTISENPWCNWRSCGECAVCSRVLFAANCSGRHGICVHWWIHQRALMCGLAFRTRNSPSQKTSLRWGDCCPQSIVHSACESRSQISREKSDRTTLTQVSYP